MVVNRLLEVVSSRRLEAMDSKIKKYVYLHLKSAL
jgi:hypothetical protein